MLIKSLIFFSEDMIETNYEIHVSLFLIYFPLINKAKQTEYYPAGTVILIENFRNSLS